MKKFIVAFFSVCVCAELMFASAAQNVELYKKLDVAQKKFSADRNGALKDFSEIASEKNIPVEVACECAKAFFKCGENSKAADLVCNETFSNSNNLDYRYLCALGFYANGKFSEAEKIFNTIDNGNYAGFAKYFSGLINYRNENYETAFDNFNDADKKLDNINFAWDAKYRSSLCASMRSYSNNSLDSETESEWLKKAINISEKCFKQAYNDEQKNKSFVLLSSLYMNSNQFSKCEEFLSNYTKSNNSLAKPAIYQLGNLYVKKGDYANADKTYQLYETRFPDDARLDEVAYRRGELWYIDANYDKAADVFSRFRFEFLNSQFNESARFYFSDCLYQTKDYSRCILVSQNFVQDFPQSNYRYQVLKNMMMCYQNEEEYAKALATAETMSREYPVQFSTEDLKKVKDSLINLGNGISKKLSEAINKFNKDPSLETEESRKNALDLAENYMQENGKDAVGKATDLLNKLVEKGKENIPKAEYSYFGRIHFLRGKIYRDAESYKIACDDFLTSANYYAKANKPEEAARALYCAVESYDCDKKDEDARAVFKTMKKLYPKSEWTEKAKKLLKQQFM